MSFSVAIKRIWYFSFLSLLLVVATHSFGRYCEEADKEFQDLKWQRSVSLGKSGEETEFEIPENLRYCENHLNWQANGKSINIELFLIMIVIGFYDYFGRKWRANPGYVDAIVISLPFLTLVFLKIILFN